MIHRGGTLGSQLRAKRKKKEVVMRHGLISEDVDSEHTEEDEAECELTHAVSHRVALNHKHKEREDVRLKHTHSVSCSSRKEGQIFISKRTSKLKQHDEPPKVNGYRRDKARTSAYELMSELLIDKEEYGNRNGQKRMRSSDIPKMDKSYSMPSTERSGDPHFQGSRSHRRHKE